MGSFLASVGLLCIYFASDEKAKNNSYTQYHLKVNLGFWFSIPAIFIFYLAIKKLQSFGKFNGLLGNLVEPFLILFRLVITSAFAYYIIFRLVIVDYLVGSFFDIYSNWWKSRSDQWITNASSFNAFINWITWGSALYIIIGWG
jgi:hypothetical protein